MSLGYFFYPAALTSLTHTHSNTHRQCGSNVSQWITAVKSSAWVMDSQHCYKPKGIREHTHMHTHLNYAVGYSNATLESCIQTEEVVWPKGMLALGSHYHCLFLCCFFCLSCLMSYSVKLSLGASEKNQATKPFWIQKLSQLCRMSNLWMLITPYITQQGSLNTFSFII